MAELGGALASIAVIFGGAAIIAAVHDTIRHRIRHTRQRRRRTP